MSQLMFIGKSITIPEKSIAWYDMGKWVYGETTLIDRSGNSNNIYVYGNPVYSSSQGGKMLFDGVNDYCDGQITCTITDGTMTFETWVKPDSSTPSTWSQYILYGNKVAGSSSTSRIFLGIRKMAADEVRTTIFQALPIINVSNTVTMSDGVWHHVVMVVNDVNTKLYVDGVLKRTDVNAGTLVDSKLENVFISMGIKDLVPAEGFLKFETTISRFYNIELTADEVLSNYNSEIGRHS